jgi:hypothetical protein
MQYEKEKIKDSLTSYGEDLPHWTIFLSANTDVYSV